MNIVWSATARLLADDTPKNTGPDFGKASPFGLVIVILLFIGTVFLVRSMNKQLKKLPESFDPEHPEPDQAVDDGTVDADHAEAVPDAGSDPGSPDGAPREPGG
ncbi:hypothetical protein BH09ACT8_BH09ACT8_31580 [soil metagenome]